MISAPQKRVTLKDVAHTAKLSVAAVSMALRNHPSLPQPTIERVKHIAEKLGYRPDPVLSALAAHRARTKGQRNSSVIAFIDDWSTPEAWLESPGARRLLTQASVQADSLGYDLQHFWAPKHGGLGPRLASVLKTRGIRHVILAPAEKTSQANRVDWSPFTVVSLEPPALDARLPHAGLDHHSNVMRCWHELTRQGITRVGFITPCHHHDFSRVQGLAAHAYQQSHVAPAADRIPELELNHATETGRIRQWIEAHRPDAIISGLPLYQQLTHGLGFAVPSDFSYISLDVTAERSPDISGIDARMETLGETVVDTLNHLQQRGLSGQAISPIGTQVTGIWQAGHTLAARAKLAKSG